VRAVVEGDDLMRVAAGDTDYESSGHGYERHRRPDLRIGALIHQHLGAGRSVVNVGAGAGSYEPAERCVLSGGALRGDARAPVVHRGGAGDQRRR